MRRAALLAVVLLLTQTTVVASADELHTGIASHYRCTAGWCDGTPTVALPGKLGGRYTGQVNGYVVVCADRCATLPVVDWCQCYVGTSDERIVDLNEAAWPLVTDAPLSRGLVKVTVRVAAPATLPDTAMRVQS